MKKNFWKQPAFKFGVLILFLAASVAVVWLSPLRRYTHPREMGTLVEKVRQTWWALPAFIGSYAVLTLLAFPGSLLTLAAGALFGVALGVVGAAIGATLGACLAFLLARLLGREWIERMMGKGPKMLKLQKELEHSGFLRVLQLRLIPLVPFNVMNYACGVTRVHFLPYFLATMLGILPATAIYVYTGYSTSRYWTQGQDAPGERRTLLLQIGISLLLLVVVTGAPMLYKRFRAHRT